MLAAKERAGFGHYRLDERVTDPCPDPNTTCLSNHFSHGLGTDHVVEHGCALVLFKDRLGDNCRRGRARERRSGLVDQKYPVSIAVKSKTYIGMALEKECLEVPQVLGLDGIGGMVRKSRGGTAVLQRPEG